MIVVYAKNIIEQILEAKAEAARKNVRIDKIILTDDEYGELKWGIPPFTFVCLPTKPQGPVTVYGIKIEVA